MGPSCTQVQLAQFHHQRFHHICLVVATLPFKEKKMYIYYDGEKQNESEF